MHDDIRNAATRRITEEAAQWMLANRAGLDKAASARFMTWLRHSPAHVGEYMAIMQFDRDVREAAQRDPVDTAALVGLAVADPAVVPLYPSRVAAGDEARAPGTSIHRKPRARRAAAWGWTAAAAACLIAAVGTWYRQPVPIGVVYSAPADAIRGLEFSDGSRIQLDRGSAIRVQFDDKRRDIAVLGGTVLIDVGHESSAPLSVTLGRTVLRDIGTVFQVRTRRDGGDVTVLSGRVDVLTPRDGWTWASQATKRQDVLAHLQAGQRATVASDGSLSNLATHAELAQDLAWLPAEIDFHDTSVADVARRFNAYGQAPLMIGDSALAAMRISGRFHARDPAGFIAYLRTLPGVQVRRDADGIHVERVRKDSRK